MIKETPFHPRTSAANETGLWSHWSGYLATDRYQMSDKFEYFAIRNSAALIDTSPDHPFSRSVNHAENVRKPPRLVFGYRRDSSPPSREESRPIEVPTQRGDSD